jgi:2-amino-4-hydroxy-6-hydroxymethyldihydropteridine diphosphokinase
VRAGIALGSNLGDRLGHLRAACGHLLASSIIGAPVRYSRIYETEPVGTASDAGAFLNAVVEVEFEGHPLTLLDELQAIEARLGRPSKRPRNASRTIDLDLLYAGNLALTNDEIVIPHPRLHVRRFVLQPLCDLRPELILPGLQKPVAELLAELGDPARVGVRPEALDAQPED